MSEQNTFEELTLSKIGSTYYQKGVIESWNLIEITESAQGRKDSMLQNIKQNKEFWNLYVALSFLAYSLKPESYLEIGVQTGCSLVVVLHNSDIKKVVGVDLWTGSYDGAPSTLEYVTAQIDGYKKQTDKRFEIEFIKGDSHKVLKRLISLGRKFDLITVDGDHSLLGAWEDLEDSVTLLNDQGVIVFDDIIHQAHPYLMSLVTKFEEKHPEFRVFINSKQDNGCAIFLRNVDVCKLITNNTFEGVIKEIEKGEHAISNPDWRLLGTFIKEHKIKTILEFGSGKSTLLFDSIGCHVTSLETSQKFADQVIPYLSSNSVVLMLDGHEAKIKGEFDMVFVDGPKEDKDREPSYRWAVALRPKFIACHDSYREYEKRWIEKHLTGYHCVGDNSYTRIFERDTQ